MPAPIINEELKPLSPEERKAKLVDYNLTSAAPITDNIPNVDKNQYFEVIANPMQAYAFGKSYDKLRNPAVVDPKNAIALSDTRSIDGVSGKRLTPKDRMNHKPDRDMVIDLIKSANRAGVDPHTVLAMSMQESGFDPNNPLYDNSQSLDDLEVMKRYAKKYPNGMSRSNMYDDSMESLKAKLDYAKKLGKSDEAGQIQAWNGYGKVNMKKGAYGLDGEIDMNSNPVYGKRIIDLRENVIKKNPQLLKLVNEYGLKAAPTKQIVQAGMAEGGEVTGPGTGKSDSIPSKLNPGDFIIPAENADEAMKLGCEYLGWDKNEKAEVKDGTITKHLSNGEVRFTAQEADYLRSKGVDLNSLAPDAQNKHMMATGGEVYDKDGNLIYNYDPNQETQQFTNPTDGSPQERTSNDATAPTTTTAPVVATPNVASVPAPKQSKSDELMAKLFATRESAPVVDEAKADRLRRMGRINTLGQSIGVLGDMFTMIQGGNVRRRQPDKVAPTLYQQYSQMIEDNKSAGDLFKFRDLQNQRENLRLGIGEEHRKEAEALQNRRWEAKTALAKSKADQDWNEFVLGFKQKQQGLDQASEEKGKDRLSREKIAAGSQSIGHERNSIAREKLTKSEEAKAGKPFDPIEVQDAAGNNVKLSQGDWDKLYQESIKDPEFKKNHLAALVSQFKNTPDAGLKQIARSYYEYKKGKAAPSSGTNYYSPPFVPAPGASSLPPGIAKPAVSPKPSLFQ